MEMNFYQQLDLSSSNNIIQQAHNANQPPHNTTAH